MLKSCMKLFTASIPPRANKSSHKGHTKHRVRDFFQKSMEKVFYQKYVLNGHVRGSK
jgi:hypothetical protein